MNREPRIAIIGTRPPSIRPDSVSPDDWKRIREHCWAWLVDRTKQGRWVLVSGGADGIDSLAEDFARSRKLSRHVITPNYDDPGLTNKRAAPIVRNGLIVADADEVHAWVKRTPGGTDDAIVKARKLGKPVTVHEPWKERQR